MMTPSSLLAHLLVLLVLPPLMMGVINRTKAWWAGRKGAPFSQPWRDLARLVRKQPVYSNTTTFLFRLGPLVVLATTGLTGLMVPLVGAGAPLVFSFDFVTLAYLWGLGRVAMMLAALDTGSAFEGMGASREATFAAILEPAFFLAMGALASATSATSMSQLLALTASRSSTAVVLLACVVAIFVVLQVEGARVPVDDPNTHLELTMIHEVMILDHAGPELAALQYSAAMKVTLCAGMIAALVWPGTLEVHPAAIGAGHVGIMLVVAVVVGCVESLMARVRMLDVPQYILVGVVAAAVALLATLGGGAL